MKRVLCLLLCSMAILLFLDGGRFSEAEERNNSELLGFYVINAQRTCLDGISDPLINSFHLQGLGIYNGDGTGKWTGRSIGFNHKLVTRNVWEVNCDVKYTVHDTMNFTQKLDCVAIRIDPSWVRMTREGIVHEGVIKGDLLLLSDHEGSEEQVTWEDEDGVITTFIGVCGSTITAVRLN